MHVHPQHTEDVLDAHDGLGIPAVKSSGGGRHLCHRFMAWIPCAEDALDAGQFPKPKSFDARQAAQNKTFAVPFCATPNPLVAGKFHEAQKVESLVDAQ